MNNSMVVQDGAILESKSKIMSKIKSVIYYLTKRSFDIACSIIGLVFMIPLILIVKISYILTGDFKSIFYTQKRIGKNGKEFNFFKFRSMIPDADLVLEKLLKENKKMRKEYQLNKKLKNDPRITKMGNVLRKTSLDELPQVLNILKGDMTVIGNRPYLPREKKDMGSYYEDIVKTKPGLTGFWQCSLRSRGTFEERLKLEKEYSEKASLLLDIKIFFKTFIVVLFGKGAE